MSSPEGLKHSTLVTPNQKHKPFGHMDTSIGGVGGGGVANKISTERQDGVSCLFVHCLSQERAKLENS